MNKYKFLPVINSLSKLSILFSLLFFTTVIVSYIFKDGLVYKNLIITVSMIFISSIIYIFTKKYKKELEIRDGFLLAIFLWLFFALISSIPFYVSIPYFSFTDAYLESISGLTTTGATMVNDLESLPKSLNFLRHFLNWLGGMGIIVLALAVLPSLRIGGIKLFKAEASIVSKGKLNRLNPRIKETADSLWAIYIFFTIILVIFLKLAGMNWFDSVCHAMSSISLGGFSTHNQNIGYFNSVKIEIVLSIGMLIGAINFATHILAFQSKSIKIYFKDQEIKVSWALLIISIIGASFYLWIHGEYNFLKSFRYTFFNYLSIILSCGYSSIDFAKWPLLVTLWMYFLANFASNTGSTGGGIKTFRVIIFIKFLVKEMVLLLHPNVIYTVRVNNMSISSQTAMTVLIFILVYILSIVILTFIMIATGLDLESAISLVVATITNTGQALNKLGPTYNFNVLNDFQKWVCGFAMFIGRLELFTVFILFKSDFWKSYYVK